MTIVEQPDKKEWKKLLQRPYVDNTAVMDKVKAILERVKQEGDEALRTFTNQFDGINIDQIQVSEAEIKEAIELVPQALKNAIQAAKKNIETFHHTQLKSPQKITTISG